MRFTKVRQPSGACAEGVRGEIGSAAIEGQVSPSTAERGHAAIAVLQVEQPFHTLMRSVENGGISNAETCECDERACGIVRVGYSAGQIRPLPCSRSGVRVRMLGRELLRQQPVRQMLALSGGKNFGRHCIDCESGEPSGEIGVNRPTSIIPNRGA